MLTVLLVAIQPLGQRHAGATDVGLVIDIVHDLVDLSLFVSLFALVCHFRILIL